MPLSMIPWRLVGTGVALVAICAVVWALWDNAYDTGYAAGKAGSREFYQPILDAAAQQAHVAKGRIEALEKASKAINSELERTHAKQNAALSDRAMRAERRLAVLLRNPHRCDGGGVPADAGTPAPSDGAAPELDGNRDAGASIAADLVTIGAGCERDAATVLSWQSWYRQQAALMR